MYFIDVIFANYDISVHKPPITSAAGGPRDKVTAGLDTTPHTLYQAWAVGAISPGLITNSRYAMLQASKMASHRCDTYSLPSKQLFKGRLIKKTKSIKQRTWLPTGSAPLLAVYLASRHRLHLFLLPHDGHLMMASSSLLIPVLTAGVTRGWSADVAWPQSEEEC